MSLCIPTYIGMIVELTLFAAPLPQLVVLVESQASHSDLRRAARETWASSPSVGGTSLVIFTVAARGLSSDR